MASEHVKKLYDKVSLHTLTIILTKKCPQRCLMCYNDHNDLEKPEEIDFNVLKRTLIHFKKAGGFYIYISGGEPFLYTQISDLLVFLERIGFEFEIVTNGLLIAQYIQLLRLQNFRSIRVSLLGLQKTHDYLTSLEGAFNKVINNFRQCDNTILEKINIAFTVHKDNYDELRDFANFMKKEFGITKIRKFRLTFNRNNFNRLRDHILSFEQMSEILRVRPKTIEYV